MEDEDSSESIGFAAKRSLKKLLKLEDPAEPVSTPVVVAAAKNVLADQASKPFDVVQSYTDIKVVYKAIVDLLRAQDQEEYLTMVSNQVKQLRETLDQYHVNLNLAPNAELEFLQYNQGVQSRAEAVAAHKSYTKDFEQAYTDINQLEKKLENAQGRRDDALIKINENLDNAKAADTIV